MPATEESWVQIDAKHSLSSPQKKPVLEAYESHWPTWASGPSRDSVWKNKGDEEKTLNIDLGLGPPHAYATRIDTGMLKPHTTFFTVPAAHMQSLQSLMEC